MQYTQLDSNNQVKTQGKSISDDSVLPSVLPLAADSMLQAVVDAWELMTDAEKALCFSMARQALGVPLFASEASEPTEST